MKYKYDVALKTHYFIIIQLEGLFNVELKF